jgi:hypothetical protein
MHENSSHTPPPVLALDDAMDVDDDDATLVDAEVDDATLVDAEVDDALLDAELDDPWLEETKPVEELTSFDPPAPPSPPESPMVSVPCAQFQPTTPRSEAMNRTAPVGRPLL